jgi:Na+-transporting NADH:ubiquinone oxidoreductase subunit C
MIKPEKIRRSLFTLLFMFLVTVVFISALTAMYLLTRDTVQANEQLYLKRAVLYAAGIPVPQDRGELDRLFRERVRAVTDEAGRTLFYEIRDPAGAGTVGYVLSVTGRGLWGPLESVVGVQKDLKTLTGIDFTRQNETPGLGARIEEPWFKEQFRGKQWPLASVPEGEQAGPRQFEAITGATNTSNGVKGILNAGLADAEKAIRPTQ